VKRNSADDSVGSPHVKVGHCQAFIAKPRSVPDRGFFICFAGNALLRRTQPKRSLRSRAGPLPGIYSKAPIVDSIGAFSFAVNRICAFDQPSPDSVSTLESHGSESCPCGARRMAGSSALLVDEVFPHQPVRRSACSPDAPAESQSDPFPWRVRRGAGPSR
jgi:hypothetical protein